LEAGIKPWVTLFHWDLPQILQDKGGFANPDSVEWFATYTDVVTKRLGDRVEGWITFNEPWCTAFLGNMMGVHAPGIQDPPTAYPVANNLMLSHGKAMPIIRQNAPEAKAGITLNLTIHTPATDRIEDIQMARQRDSFINGWFLDPIYKGCYPSEV